MIDDDLTPIVRMYQTQRTKLRRRVRKAVHNEPELTDLKTPKADVQALNRIYLQYMRVFTGKHIAAAALAWKKGDHATAATEFETARNGFQRKKNPTEWNALEAWRKAAEAKSGPAAGPGTEAVEPKEAT